MRLLSLSLRSHALTCSRVTLPLFAPSALWKGSMTGVPLLCICWHLRRSFSVMMAEAEDAGGSANFMKMGSVTLSLPAMSTWLYTAAISSGGMPICILINPLTKPSLSMNTPLDVGSASPLLSQRASKNSAVVMPCSFLAMVRKREKFSSAAMTAGEGSAKRTKLHARVSEARVIERGSVGRTRRS